MTELIDYELFCGLPSASANGAGAAAPATLEA